ncbi:MAG TPA: hypothetical protein VF753_14075 [Terriglobales bacterium]
MKAVRIPAVKLRVHQRQAGLMAGRVVLVVAALAVGLSATFAMAQKSSEMSELEIQAALHRALPGAVAAHSAPGPVSFESGAMGTGSMGREVEMADLPQALHMEAGENEDHDRPMSGLTEKEYQALKRLVAKRAAAGEIGAAPSAMRSPGPISEKQAYVGPKTGFIAQSEVCCDPPDMSLAVGPTYVLQMVNNYVAVYSKTGTLQSGFPKSADTFFGLANGTYTTDPRAFYDWENGHYFVLELSETNTGNPNGSPNVGTVAWAVSKTNDPRGTWYVYSSNLQQAAGVCPDFPTLGNDNTNWGSGATKGGIYIGLNLWSGANDCGGDHYTGNVIFIIPKDALYSGGGYSYWYITGLEDNGTLLDTFQPYNVTAKTTNPSSIFWVNSFNYNWGGGICSGGCNGLVVWSESGPSTAPNNPFAFLSGGGGPVLIGKVISTTHNYSTPVYASGPNCPAASGPCVDTDYNFISGGVKYNAGELFGSFNTGVATSPAVTGPIWFELHPVTSNNVSQLTSVEERQEDCFLCGGWASNGSAYYATLQPDPENNVLMVFDFSSDTVYPGMANTSRRVTYGDSLMDGGGVFLVSGSGSGVSGRWGDYSATSPDLNNGNITGLWFAAQYAPSGGGWGTAIGLAQYNKQSTNQ